jgi:type II secretory pathway pseudopilin PulG
MNRTDGGFARSLAVTIVVFGFVLALGLTVIGAIDRRSAAREEELVHDAVRSALITCYAVEGAYPPSLDYITENYRVQIDTERYTVRYELFASNLMPDVTVLDNEK